MHSKLTYKNQYTNGMLPLVYLGVMSKFAINSLVVPFDHLLIIQTLTLTPSLNTALLANILGPNGMIIDAATDFNPFLVVDIPCVSGTCFGL